MFYTSKFLSPRAQDLSLPNNKIIELQKAQHSLAQDVQGYSKAPHPKTVCP